MVQFILGLVTGTLVALFVFSLVVAGEDQDVRRKRK